MISKKHLESLVSLLYSMCVSSAAPEPPKPKEEAAPTPAPKSGKYIPPGMRRAMESGASGTCDLLTSDLLTI